MNIQKNLANYLYDSMEENQRDVLRQQENSIYHLELFAAMHITQSRISQFNLYHCDDGECITTPNNTEIAYQWSERMRKS